MKKQSGRSMLEMLTVLAVVGILSIIALIGVPFLMNKNQANKVISDASSVYAAVESTEIRYPDWTEYPITAESGFVFKVIRAEEKGILVTYVQAIEVPEKICKHMLNMKGEKLAFYDVREYEDLDDEEDEDGTGKAYYVELAEKTVCEELNNIGITFDGKGVGGVMAFHAPGNGEGSEGGNVSSPGVIDPEDPPCEADLIEITKCNGTKVKCCPDGGNVCVSPTDCCTDVSACTGMNIGCIENECRCPDGYFQNQNLNCTECTNFAEKVPISDASCLSCNPDPSNPTVRKMSGGKCVPFDKNNCPSGKYKGRIGSDNLCFACSDPRAYVPTSGSCPSECSAEREMIGSNCVLKCSDGQFRGNNGTCYNCTEPSRIIPMSGQCDRCSAERTMSNGYCVLKDCPTGTFPDVNGSCHDCKEAGNIEVASDSVCSRCGADRIFKPQTSNGHINVCGRCADGEFYQTDFMTCRGCSSGERFVSTDAACSACDGTTSPRHMINNLCWPINCPNGYVKGSDETCYKCQVENKIDLYEGEDCVGKCSGTAYPRKLNSDGQCVLANCPAGKWQGAGGGCFSCDTNDNYVPASEAECLKCNTGNYTHRKMFGTLCVKDDSCSGGQFYRFVEGKNGSSCVDCSYDGPVTTTTEECAKCSNYTERKYINGKCLKKCSANQFTDSDGKCKNCSTQSIMEAYTEQECKSCTGTGNARQVKGDKCVRKCDSGQFLMPDGTCHSCSDFDKQLSYDSDECDYCNGARCMLQHTQGSQADNLWYCARCGGGTDGQSCPLGRFRNYNLNCTACTLTGSAGKPTSEAECNKCDYEGTPHKRAYRNGTCYYN